MWSHGHTLTPKFCMLLRRVPGRPQRPPRVSVRWGRQLLMKNCELHLAGAPHRCRGLVTHDSRSGSMLFMPDSGPRTRESLRVAGQVGEPVAAGLPGARAVLCSFVAPWVVRSSTGSPEPRGAQRLMPAVQENLLESFPISGAQATAVLWEPGSGGAPTIAAHNLSPWAPTRQHWRLTGV